MLPRLISNSWAQNISLLQPSEYSRLEVCTTVLVLLMAVFSFLSCALLWIPSPLLHPYFKHGCSGLSFWTFKHVLGEKLFWLFSGTLLNI